MPHQGRQLKAAVDRYKPKDPGKSSKIKGFAALMGISRQWAYRYFSKAQLDPEFKRRAAQVLDIPEAEIFTLYDNTDTPLPMVGEDLMIRSGNLLEDLGNGLYRLHTLLVDQKSARRYAVSWGDNEYLASLSTCSITVSSRIQGLYRSFQVPAADESMLNPDNQYSVGPGDIVTGRLLNRSLWAGGLHTSMHPFWAIIHKLDGVLIRQITAHDAEAGTITCSPLSPDRSRFPETTIRLDDVVQLFNLIRIEKDC